MGTNVVVIAAFCVAVIIGASGLIYYLVRTLRREDEFFQEYRDYGVTTVVHHAKDPFWHTDQHGRYMEFDDGHRLYWSKDFDPDDVSS